ncbi:Bifunctional adenosylcobalamin biosynthesis protein CobP [[Clostridium] ultunense Esp]|nr:Bifunctional adenosylcobalamin biosynthesis protein CobP [[Clostridium] ultunense Esp]
MTIHLVLGGIRSGKSRVAEELAQGDGGPVSYVATNVCMDEEMKERIRLHQARRPLSWRVMEEPLDLKRISSITEGDRVVLLDSLSAWLSNRLSPIPEAEWRGARHNERIIEDISRFLEVIKGRDQNWLIVSDEIGLGGVALYPLGRWYADLLGELNQRVASVSDEVTWVVAGLPLRLKGEQRG